MSLGAKIANMNEDEKALYLSSVLAEFRQSDAFEVLSWMLWSKTTAIIERLSDPDLTPDDRQYLGGALSSMGAITEITEEWAAISHEMNVVEEGKKRFEEHVEQESVQIYTGTGGMI